MNKKTIIIIIIVIISFIGILVGNHIYTENDYFEYIVFCDFNSEYSNYQERLQFTYVENILYEYRRDEYFKESKDNSLKEIYDFFQNEKDNYKDDLNENFKYEVKYDSDSVHIFTYIKTIYNEDFYNSYIDKKGITFSSTPKEVITALSDEYTCRIEKR